MDPHLRGQQIDAFDGRERLFSGQRGRGGVLRTSQAGVLPQEKLRGCFDGRVHRHAQRLHGLVPGQADQDRVRHEHHGPAAQARPRGIIRRQEQGSPTKRHHPQASTSIWQNTPWWNDTSPCLPFRSSRWRGCARCSIPCRCAWRPRPHGRPG